VSRAKAEWTYRQQQPAPSRAALAKQFVTVDQVDRAKDLEIAQSEALKQADSH